MNNVFGFLLVVAVVAGCTGGKSDKELASEYLSKANRAMDYGNMADVCLNIYMAQRVWYDSKDADAVAMYKGLEPARKKACEAAGIR